MLIWYFDINYDNLINWNFVHCEVAIGLSHCCLTGSTSIDLDILRSFDQSPIYGITGETTSANCRSQSSTIRIKRFQAIPKVNINILQHNL